MAKTKETIIYQFPDTVTGRSERADFVRDVLTAKAGQFFTVKFIKRTNNRDRTMLAQYNGTKDREPSHHFDPEEKMLLRVWDRQKDAPRYISLDAVYEIHVGGTVILIEDAPRRMLNVEETQALF